ncbi:hypothetical protein [Euzebya pacifica]|nr:hypothetical protein [Euzebya pacifica]
MRATVPPHTGCDVVTHGCIDAADRDAPVRTRCFACGLTACRGCTVITAYFPRYGTRRVCFHCLVTHDLWTDEQVDSFIASRAFGQEAVGAPPGGFRCNRPLRRRDGNCAQQVHAPGIPCATHGTSR